MHQVRQMPWSWMQRDYRGSGTSGAEFVIAETDHRPPERSCAEQSWDPWWKCGNSTDFITQWKSSTQDTTNRSQRSSTTFQSQAFQPHGTLCPTITGRRNSWSTSRKDGACVSACDFGGGPGCHRSDGGHRGIEGSGSKHECFVLNDTEETTPERAQFQVFSRSTEEVDSLVCHDRVMASEIDLFPCENESQFSGIADEKFLLFGAHLFEQPCDPDWHQCQTQLMFPERLTVLRGMRKMNATNPCVDHIDSPCERHGWLSWWRCYDSVKEITEWQRNWLLFVFCGSVVTLVIAVALVIGWLVLVEDKFIDYSRNATLKTVKKRRKWCSKRRSRYKNKVTKVRQHRAAFLVLLQMPQALGMHPTPIGRLGESTNFDGAGNFEKLPLTTNVEEGSWPQALQRELQQVQAYAYEEGNLHDQLSMMQQPFFRLTCQHSGNPQLQFDLNELSAHFQINQPMWVRMWLTFQHHEHRLQQYSCLRKLTFGRCPICPFVCDELPMSPGMEPVMPFKPLVVADETAASQARNEIQSTLLVTYTSNDLIQKGAILCTRNMGDLHSMREVFEKVNPQHQCDSTAWCRITIGQQQFWWPEMFVAMNPGSINADEIGPGEIPESTMTATTFQEAAGSVSTCQQADSTLADVDEESDYQDLMQLQMEVDLLSANAFLQRLPDRRLLRIVLWNEPVRPPPVLTSGFRILQGTTSEVQHQFQMMNCPDRLVRFEPAPDINRILVFGHVALLERPPEADMVVILLRVAKMYQRDIGTLLVKNEVTTELFDWFAPEADCVESMVCGKWVDGQLFFWPQTVSLRNGQFVEINVNPAGNLDESPVPTSECSTFDDHSITESQYMNENDELSTISI